jgi:hypothetical protein
MGNDRSLLLQLGRELRDSIHAGAALAALTLATGCSGKDVTRTDIATGDPPTTTPANTTTTTTTTTTISDPSDGAVSATDASDAATPDLLPRETYALAQLGCFGPSHDDGYYGQCCFEAHCYAPEAGAACLAAADRAGLHSKIHLPLGSGSCGCSVQGDHPEIAGPFASNPADHSTADAGGSSRSGGCCYVVGSISCTGRPFCVDGTQLLAEVVARADWLLG